MLKFPDQVNLYDIKTEIYEGKTVQEEIFITFEVSQTVLSRIDELIVEIESMNTAGRDARFLRKAVNKLQKIILNNKYGFLYLIFNPKTQKKFEIFFFFFYSITIEEVYYEKSL
jgi:hypothetical protein